MSEVKRYIVAGLPGRMTRDCVEVVKARDYDALKDDNERLREALGDAREALFIIGCHPIKHDPLAYVVVRGIADKAIDVADAALSAAPSDSPADVKTVPQMDLTKPVPTKAGSALAAQEKGDE